MRPSQRVSTVHEARRRGMQGVCKGGVCVCQPGYRGAYCEIPPACSGILDQDGNCCATGIVSQNGTCCAQASTPSSARTRNSCARVSCERPSSEEPVSYPVD